MFLDFLGIGEGIFKLLILIVAGIYKLVSGVYQIFLVLAKTNLFGQETYAHLTDKVYIILAVVMLFVVAYTFITLIVDPDKNKGGKAVEDLIKKTVTSLILIVLCPTLFTFAFDLQDAILDQDIIGKFFTTSNTGYDGQKSIKEGGNLMAGTTFAAFFYPAHSQTEATEVTNKSSIGTLTSGSYKITCDGGLLGTSCTLQDAIDYATHTGEFKVFTAFAKNWLEDDDVKTGIDFSFLMALIAGGYLVFVIISFCFDLAVRVVKLAFYQIIAPICIACRIIPNKDSIYKNWWKAVCKTYLAVFIRVFIMNLAVFLMTELTQTDFWGSLCNPAEFECSGVVKFLAYAFLIMGLLTFVKQSTKLIDEIFGLGDVKLGITDKLREGGGFTAAAAARAGVRGTAAGFKNGLPGSEKWKNMGVGKKVGSVLKATGRGALVGAGAMTRSLGTSTNGFGSDKFKQEWSKTGANAKVASQRSEIGMEKLGHLPATMSQLWSDFRVLLATNRQNRDLEHELADLQRQLNEHTRNGELEAALRLKANIEEARNELARRNALKQEYIDSIASERTRKQAEVDAAQQHLNDLTIAGANAETIRTAREDLQNRMDELNAIAEDPDRIAELDQSIREANSRVNSAQSRYQEAARHYADNNGQTVDEAEAQYQAEINEIQRLIDERNASKSEHDKQIKDLELTNVINNIKENINKYCFQNPTGILEVLDERLDGITKKIEKVSSKYNHAISVNFEAALKKNTLLNGLTAAQKEALLNDSHFKLGEASVQTIEGISKSLKNATTFDQVEGILGAGLCSTLGITSGNFTNFQQAFIDTIDNPYHKEVIKATADAVNRHENANIVIKPSQVSVVLEDRDSEDARTEEFAYQVAYEAIYGKGGDVASYDSKKKTQDSLRDASRSGQRHDIRKKVQNQIFTVNTEDKKGNK